MCNKRHRRETLQHGESGCARFVEELDMMPIIAEQDKAEEVEEAEASSTNNPDCATTFSSQAIRCSIAL